MARGDARALAKHPSILCGHRRSRDDDPRIIKRNAWVQRPTLDRIADATGLDRAELRALRPKNPRQSAHSLTVAADMESDQPGRMRQLSEKGRAKIDYYAPRADRVDGGKTAAVAALRRRTPEHDKAFHDGGARSSAERKNGVLRPCVFCGCPRHLIYQTPARSARGHQQYHRQCWLRWWGQLPQRDRARSMGTIGWIWSRVKSSGDEKLKGRIKDQMRAQLDYLRNPHRRGAPPKLLRHKEIAIQAALHYELGSSTRWIGEQIGWDGRYANQKGDKGSHRWAWEMVRLGRVLLGLEAGPEMEPGFE